MMPGARAVTSGEIISSEESRVGKAEKPYGIIVPSPYVAQTQQACEILRPDCLRQDELFHGSGIINSMGNIHIAVCLH